jgi:hypothetical protein
MIDSIKQMISLAYSQIGAFRVVLARELRKAEYTRASGDTLKS